MTNVNLGGKGQARDGDFTTTGATCIAIGNAYHCEGRAVLRKGDVTTACPRCKQTGVIVESCPWLISDGAHGLNLKFSLGLIAAYGGDLF